MKELIERIRGNPKTSALAVAALIVYSCGEALSNNGFEPWGTIISGIGGTMAGIGLLLARDTK